MKQAWFCLTVEWDNGNVQSIWIKHEKVAQLIREDLAQNEHAKKIHYHRYDDSPKETPREKA